MRFSIRKENPMLYDSAARIESLDMLAASRRKIVQEATDRMQELSQSLARAQRKLREILDQPQRFLSPQDQVAYEKRNRELERQIEDLKASHALARERATEARRDLEPAATLAHRCREFAVRNGLPLPVDAGYLP
ncbi:MAG: hypothetical protein CTY39_02635 [Hyphomicrobium sp.]|nr:MAG: hypothetical protein CTY39_02635 [Hyphomicrobium sp.]